jgi:hypothetical protein
VRDIVIRLHHQATPTQRLHCAASLLGGPSFRQQYCQAGREEIERSWNGA